MSSSFRVACIQTSSQLDMGTNLEAASALVRDAAKGGAQFSEELNIFFDASVGVIFAAFESIFFDLHATRHQFVDR